MATAFVGAHAPSFQPRVVHNATYPEDYFALLHGLAATETKEQLRQWALSTATRRAALPRDAQASLRELTIGQQNIIRGSRDGIAATAISDRDCDHIGQVVRRLLDVLHAHAHLLTPDEARDFADCIRNTAAHLMPVVIEGEAN